MKKPRTGRPPSLSKRRHRIPVQLDDAALGRLDAARGDTPRAEYLYRFGVPSEGDPRTELAARLRALNVHLTTIDDAVAEAQDALDAVEDAAGAPMPNRAGGGS